MHDNAFFQAGSAIGARLLEHAKSISSPREKAAAFVDGIISQMPKLKAPTLLADAEVKRWMTEQGVSDCHIREALTAARSVAREAATDSVPKVVRPKRTRSREKVAAPEPHNAPTPLRSDPRRIVEDKPLEGGIGQ